MVVIRLARGGAKKRPFYHVVVADKRRPRDGRCIERIGYFNPVAAGKEIRLRLESERVQYWISQGAQPSERVQSLIRSHEKASKAAAVEAATEKKPARTAKKTTTKSVQSKAKAADQASKKTDS